MITTTTMQTLHPASIGAMRAPMTNPAVHVSHRRRAQRAPAAASGPDYSGVQRNLALELVRVTEAAALAAGRWFGKGDKEAADDAAVQAMRKVLNSCSMDGVVVIGEGEKDEAPMLFIGERLGDGSPTAPAVDVAVDPLDGTTLIAQGRNGAICVIAVAERGTLFDPGACVYMVRLRSLHHCWTTRVDHHRRSWWFPQRLTRRRCPWTPLWRTISKQWHGPCASQSGSTFACYTFAFFSSSQHQTTTTLLLPSMSAHHGIPHSDVTVCLLDRPRHAHYVQACRDAGARIRLIADGDIAGAIDVAKDGSPVDVMMGIGGTPEGIIAAAALTCMGGSMLGRLWPRNDEERAATAAKGFEVDRVLHTTDLCSGRQVFFAATGVSDGDLLRGVRYHSGGASTHSMVMRSESGTVRMIETSHRWAQPGLTNMPEALLSASDLDGGHAGPLLGGRYRVGV